jgi:hypothetical protein
MNFKKLSILLSVFLLVFGVNISFAQTKKPTTTRKKPVLKKKTTTTTTTNPTTTIPTKPAVKMYSVEQGQVVRVRMNTTLSSKTAKIGDSFNTTVTEPVYSNTGVIVIPNGAILVGKVKAVTPAKKGGKPGTIDVNFVEVKIPNGSKYVINGDLTELDSKTAKSDNEGTASGDKMKHRKVIFIGGGAGVGAILGAAVGGGLGTAIGAGAGAGAGMIADMLIKGEEATVKSGTEFGIYLNQPVSLPKFVEKDDN